MKWFGKEKIFIIGIIIACCLSGCAAEKDSYSGKETETVLTGQTVADLFEESEDQEKETDEDIAKIAPGWMTGNIVTPYHDDNNKAYVIYEGGEMKLDYFFAQSGTVANQMGVILYLNGIPHPYRVMGLDQNVLREEKTDCDEIQYMHKFLPKDGEEVNITLCFTPMFGQKGETLEVCVSTFIDPDYSPFSNTKGGLYALYHEIAPVIRPMIYQADSPDEKNLFQTKHSFLNTNVSKREMSSEKKREYERYWGYDEEYWWENVYFAFYVDGTAQKVRGKYDVGDQDTVQLTVELFGPSGVKYYATVYVNHEPLNTAEEDRIEVELQQGMISVVDIELDISEIAEGDAVYVVLSPESYWRWREINVWPELQKTGTVWLTRGEDN